MLNKKKILFVIHRKDALQIIAEKRQQSPNLRMPVVSYKKRFGL